MIFSLSVIPCYSIPRPTWQRIFEPCQKKETDISSPPKIFFAFPPKLIFKYTARYKREIQKIHYCHLHTYTDVPCKADIYVLYTCSYFSPRNKRALPKTAPSFVQCVCPCWAWLPTVHCKRAVSPCDVVTLDGLTWKYWRWANVTTRRCKTPLTIFCSYHWLINSLSVYRFDPLIECW